MFNEDYVDMFTRFNKRLQNLDLTTRVSINIFDFVNHLLLFYFDNAIKYGEHMYPCSTRIHFASDVLENVYYDNFLGIC